MISTIFRQYSAALSQIATLMIASGVLFIILFIVFFFYLRLLLHQRKKSQTRHNQREICFAFFHPYCNAGGGGERVLWVAIRSLQKRYRNIKCVVYSGDTDASSDEIMARVRNRFNIVLPRQVEFVFLNYRSWVQASKYPYFTLLGQSIGSVVLGLEALFKFVPDIYIDTMGYAFTLPLFRYVGSCPVACYVHYPTISTDMLSRVSDRVQAHNNASFISRSIVLSNAKLLYYKLFASLYGIAGKRSNVIMVNSSWTYDHIVELWGVPSKTNIVYPPCDILRLMKIPLETDEKKPQQVLSLGQFRPEKDHPLQVNSFHKFLQSCDVEKRSQYKLVLAGSCRNSGDQERVKNLQKLVKELNMEDNVEFQVNISFSELEQLLANSMVSIHTMWNEHFGICLVEAMAAGNVILAHKSGGPLMDIVVDFHNNPTGFLASDVDSYASALAKIFYLTPQERLKVRINARESLTRFSEESFESVFLDLCAPLFKKFSLETR